MVTVVEQPRYLSISILNCLISQLPLFMAVFAAASVKNLLWQGKFSE